MTAEPNKDAPLSESTLPAEMVASNRLKDLGIISGEGEASYRWSIAFSAMIDAVKVVRKHGFRLPEAIQADLQLRFFKLCKDMDSFANMWGPSVREEAKRQLLNESEEQKRLQAQKVKALEKVREREGLDMIIDTEPPPEPGPKQPVPTREDLWNAMLQLQKQITKLDDKLYTLENRKQ